MTASMGAWWRSAGLFALLAGMALDAHAGPPYLTDDPVPVDLGHWEIYGFSQGSFVSHEYALALPATEINYGALPELQLHMQVSMAVFGQTGFATEYGLGDAEIGFKYRILDPGDSDWWPQMAVYPHLYFPSGSAARGLGTGQAHVFLPLWFEKDFGGGWSSTFGGGYWFNPGPGNRNYWYLGLQVQHPVTAGLVLGAEIFTQSASTTVLQGELGYPAGTRQSTGFNVGAVYDFTPHHHLIMSAGTGIVDAARSDVATYYVGYQLTF
jgi:hypothetical protein